MRSTMLATQLTKMCTSLTGGSVAEFFYQLVLMTDSNPTFHLQNLRRADRLVPQQFGWYVMRFLNGSALFRRGRMAAHRERTARR